MKERHRQNREFSKETKREALIRAEYACEQCGVHHDQSALQAHHILGLWYAYNHHPEISSVVLKSLENCMIVCPDCHDELHHSDWWEEEMDDQAQHLLKFQTQNMFDDDLYATA